MFSSLNVIASIAYIAHSYSWNALPPLPTSLGYICGGIYNNKIHILGGYDSNGLQQNEYTTTIQYDNKSNTIHFTNWSVTTISSTFPTITELGSDTQQYVTIDEFLYIMGTDDRIGLEDAPGKLIIYNMKTKTFKDTNAYSSTMIVQRTGNCITTDNTYIYSIGGHDNWGLAQKDFIKYHIHNDTWSNGAYINHARYSAQCVIVLEKLYVIGGGSYEGAVLNMEIFNLNDESKPWIVEDIPGIISSSFAYNVSSNGIYLSGGANISSISANAVSTSYLYNISNKSWSIKESMITAAYGFASMIYIPNPKWMFIVHIGGVVRDYSCGFPCWTADYSSVSQYIRIEVTNASISQNIVVPSTTEHTIASITSIIPTLYVGAATETLRIPGDSESEKRNALNDFVAGYLFYIMISIGSIDFMVFLLCMCYIFTGLRKRAKEPVNASWCVAIKEFRFIQYIGIILELFDITTDYVFASDLIVAKSDDTLLVILGWISLVIAILGVILFLCKYSLLKKLLGVQIKRYKEELKQTQNNNNHERNLIMRQIRIRKIDIDVLSLLNSSVEDLPQTMIILIYLNNFGFTYISVVSISISILSFMLKLFSIIMTSFGCNDVEDKVTKHQRVCTEGNIQINQIKIQTIPKAMFNYEL
eukprot:24543_1